MSTRYCLKFLPPFRRLILLALCTWLLIWSAGTALAQPGRFLATVSAPDGTPGYVANGRPFGIAGLTVVDIADIPTKTEIVKAHLYWLHIIRQGGDKPALTVANINGTPVNGVNIDDDSSTTGGCTVVGVIQTRAYRADVTNIVSQKRNGNYEIVVSSPDLTDPNTHVPVGAALVVVYDTGGFENMREVQIDDRQVFLPFADQASWPTHFTLPADLTSDSEFLNPSLQVGMIGGIGNAGLLDTWEISGNLASTFPADIFNNSEGVGPLAGQSWDTDTIASDIISDINGGGTQVTVEPLQVQDCIGWVATVLSTPITCDSRAPRLATVTFGKGQSSLNNQKLIHTITANFVETNFSPTDTRFAICPNSEVTIATTDSSGGSPSAEFTKQGFGSFSCIPSGASIECVARNVTGTTTYKATSTDGKDTDQLSFLPVAR